MHHNYYGDETIAQQQLYTHTHTKQNYITLHLLLVLPVPPVTAAAL